MSIEIRKARPEEMEDFKKVNLSSLMMSPPEHLTSDLTLCGFVDGKLATSYAAWNLTTVINGKDIPTAGITMVGTHPVYRRMGTLKKVTHRHFEILHELGRQPVSALYASRAAIYRRYGYSPVVTGCSYTVEPRYLQFIAGSQPSGNFRVAGISDLALLAEMYDQFINNRTGYLRRNEDNWKRRLNPPARDHTQNFVLVYEEEGEPQGYVFYNAYLIPDGPRKWNQLITITDLVWLTPPALRAIWELFSRMDVIDAIKWNQAPDDDPLPHLLQEPRMLTKTTKDGLLARIVDVEKAMDKRGYDADGMLTFKVHDDFCEWNEGTWKLEVVSGKARLTATDESPQIELPLSTLTMLYFGQISATRAFRMGRLDAFDTGSLADWDRVMQTAYLPCCADNF